MSNVFSRSRISVGAISESRHIGGNWRVGNRSSLLQKRWCVSNVFSRSRISVGAISESRHIGGNWRVGNRSSLLLHVEFASPMRIILWLSDEPFSDGVLVAIANYLVQRFIAANPVVIIVRLPERTGTRETCVNFVRRESPKGLDKPRQGLFISKLKDRVDMVWHNHYAYPFHTFVGFEPVEASKNNVRDTRKFQDGRSIVGSECNGVVCARYRFSAFPQLAVSLIGSLVHVLARSVT